MRILLLLREFYCPSLPIGGAERQALKLAGELHKMGVSVRIVTGLWEWGQPRHEVIQGIYVDRHFTAWGIFGIKGLRKFGFYAYLLSLFLYLVWHRTDYDIIHCQSALVEASIGVLAGRWLKKPVLIRPMASGTFGDFKRLHERRDIWGQDFLVRELTRADAIVALNPQISDEMAALGVAQDRIILIPNGVDTRLKEALRNHTRCEPLRILFAGRLHPQKGIGTLLKALARLAKDRPGLTWRLQLAGTGPLEHELKVMAKELGIDQGVVFLGHLDEVYPILAECDCFVLPSLSEGMSNALLEAMACGLPCIATDIPGNNSLIQHQRNGLLVPPGDDRVLADAITALSESEELRLRLGREALKTVEGKYSIHCVAKQYAVLYADLLRRKAE